MEEIKLEDLKAIVDGLKAEMEQVKTENQNLKNRLSITEEVVAKKEDNKNIWEGIK